MKNEAYWKGILVKSVNAAGGYAIRVEDQYRVGVLDLILSMPSTGIVLAEAKIVDGVTFGPSPRQLEEMARIVDGGGRCCIIGVKGNAFHFHEYFGEVRRDWKVKVGDCYRQNDTQTPAAAFEGWFKSRGTPK